MKFTADRKSISKVLSLIQGLTGKKTDLIITSDVLIKAESPYITIIANNLETVFQGQYEADIESDGIISINAKKLFEIVREYPDTLFPVNEIENRWVEIGEGNIQYHIVSSDYENFPETPVIEDISFIEIDAVKLKRMAEVSASVNFSTEEKRIYVLGVLFENINLSERTESAPNTDEKTDSDLRKENQQKIRMVSTDSRRLYCIDYDCEGIFNLPETIILIPKKGLSELGKFLDTDDKVKLGIKDNHLIVRKENETMMIKLLDGEFPNYERVLNTDPFTSVEVDRNLFLMMMKRMSILTSDDYKSVIFSFNENELTVTITNPDIGESKEELAVGYSGTAFECAFNPKYFIDALNAVKSDRVILYVKDEKNPCIIHGVDDTSLVCVVMAMSV